MNRENLLYSTLFTLNIIFSFPSLVVLVQTISGTGITSYIALGLGILLIPLLSILIFQHLLKFRTPLFIIEYILSLLFASWGWILSERYAFCNCAYTFRIFDWIANLDSTKIAFRNTKRI